MQMAGLVTVAVYYDLPEAAVARSFLNSNGVRAMLFDESYSHISWMHIHALMGLRLMVPEVESEAAVALLASGDLVMEDGAVDHCPVCGSGNIFRGKSWIVGLICVVCVAIPCLLTTRRRRCRRCGRRWRAI